MLRKIRITLQVIFFVLVTLLFLDFTGVIKTYFGWMAKIQFLPAVLALNVGIIIFLVVLTLLFGRVYCSVICPLGTFQDIASHIHGKHKRNRFVYKPAHTLLRIIVLVVFIALFFLGLSSIAGIIAPYSAYGRIATTLLAPVYQLGNDLLAYLSEKMNSYGFYHSNYIYTVGVSFAVAIVTAITVWYLGWYKGRLYCNSICPVGTILGFLSKFSLFKIAFDTSKCNGCKLCARNCKASCINPDLHKIDFSRCVACMDCIDNCHQGAIHYAFLPKKVKKHEETEQHDGSSDEKTDNSRRTFLTLAGTFAVASAVKAQKQHVDGGLAVLKDKEVPERKNRLTPPGSLSADNMASHCTACQLCIASCPNHVLKSSSNLSYLMQPEMSFVDGFCRPECTRCSEVCPTGAIRPITKAEKSSTQIGHAVWISKNCLVMSDGINCGNCFRHCPNGAIQMVPVNSDDDPEDDTILKRPSIDTSRCIGCGACEYVCPVRPFSAIHVDGHLVHKTN
jgi:ferredoxin